MRIVVVFMVLFNVTFAQLEPKLKWERFYDGLGQGLDMMNASVFDDLQNIYIAGRSSNESNGHSLLILKYSNLGDLLYTIRYNSNKSSWNEAYSIALDSLRNIYCIGIASFNLSSSICIIQKYSESGELIWHKDFLNQLPRYSEGVKIIVDSDNNVIAGYNLNGANITKYSPSGDSLWSTVIENDTSDYTILDIINDGNNIYSLIEKSTYQGGEFPEIKTIVNKLDGKGEILWQRIFDYSTMDKMILDKNKNLIIKAYENQNIIKIAPTGDFIWGKEVDGLITDIKCDSQNNVLYCGYGGGIAGMDMTIGKISENGDYKWSKKYNSPYNINDFGSSLTIDDSNYVYVSMSAHNSISMGRGFILKYGMEGELRWQFEYNNPESMFTFPFDIFTDDSMNIFTVGEISMLSNDKNIFVLKISQELKTEVKNTEIEIASFNLFQNYPNPFNPSTIISYQIASAGKVSLKVYDVLGKEVAVLVDEYRDAGLYTVNFNGSNLASGIYLYKLESGSFVSTKKLVLLR